MPFRTVAIPTSTADSVRTTLASPGYGHPAHVEVANGHGPCRHCLRTFRVESEVLRESESRTEDSHFQHLATGQR